MSVELSEQMISADEARRLTERIRLTAMTVRDGIEKLQGLVETAKNGNAHLALGYPSWTAYLADTLGAEPLRLPRDQRQELVGYLAGEGMSTRAIGAVVGASHPTVINDLRSTGQDLPVDRPATVTSLDGRERPATRPTPPANVDSRTGEIDAEQAGKPQPRRRPLIDAFGDVVADLDRSCGRLERLAEDERLPRNADQVAAKYRSDLIRARDVLDDVIGRLNTY